MPSFYQHLTIAVIAVALLLLNVMPDYSVLFLSFLISSLIPDLDSKNSTIRKNAAMIIPAAMSFFVVLNTPTNMETRVLGGVAVFFAAHIAINSLPLAHRGARSLHRAKPAIMLPIMLGMIVWLLFRTPEPWKIITASFLGYASHIAADKVMNKR
ncbi:MAG: hypothetical protein V1836_00050 [Candidatus Aenigmatarchaeota archaeon]